MTIQFFCYGRETHWKIENPQPRLLGAEVSEWGSCKKPISAWKCTSCSTRISGLQGPSWPQGSMSSWQAQVPAAAKNTLFLLRERILKKAKLRWGVASFGTWECTNMCVLWFGSRLANTCCVVDFILGTEHTQWSLQRQLGCSLKKWKPKQITLIIVPKFCAYLAPTSPTWMIAVL